MYLPYFLYTYDTRTYCLPHRCSLLQDADLDAVASISWIVPQVDSNTLQAGSSVLTQVDLTFESGLRHTNLGSSAFASWLSIGSMIAFSSGQERALTISSEGELTLLDNHYAAVSLTAALWCSASAVVIHRTYANVLAAPMDVDLGFLTGLQFLHGAGASSLEIEVHVSPAALTVLKAFMIKLGPLPAAALNSASGSFWEDCGTFSGVESQFDNPSTEVVLSAADTASTVASQVTLGTVHLNVLGSGVHLVEGEISSLVVQDSTGIITELQYLSIVAGRGYVSLVATRRRSLDGGPLSPLLQFAANGQRLGDRHLQQTCDPCASRVWGDFNGDCQFLVSDVLALSEFVLSRERFESGYDYSDPLLSYTGIHGHSCNFLREQANPSQDLMAQACMNTTDVRYGRPAVTVVDTQHMLYATVKKHRFLTSMTASCSPSSGPGSAAEFAHVTVDLSGGDGQNAAPVNADPAFTDVFLEIHISPDPIPFTLEVSRGVLESSRGVAGGFVVRAESVGSGTYEARLRPTGGYPSGDATYEMAVVVETKTASGSKELPSAYKAWLGTSLSPLTDYGVSFSNLWGGALSAVSRKSLSCHDWFPLPSQPPSPSHPPLSPLPRPPLAAQFAPLLANISLVASLGGATVAALAAGVGGFLCCCCCFCRWSRSRRLAKEHEDEEQAAKEAEEQAAREAEEQATKETERKISWRASQQGADLPSPMKLPPVGVLVRVDGGDANAGKECSSCRQRTNLLTHAYDTDQTYYRVDIYVLYFQQAANRSWGGKESQVVLRR